MLNSQSTSGQNGAEGSECLIAIRSDVLNDAEHAVGNILQRIHHLARVLQAGAAGEQRQRLQSSLGDLERILELLFDYVSPVEVEVRPTDASRIAGSLGSQLRHYVGEEVGVEEAPDLQVLADPRALGRAFQLVALACGERWKSASAQAGVHCRVADHKVCFSVEATSIDESGVGAAERVAFAVAGRLVELQGGELEFGDGARAGSIAVTLPVMEAA